MLIFCRCCEYLGVKDEKLYCNKLEMIKQSETAENYHSCTEYQYYYRPEKPDIMALLMVESEIIK